MITFNQKTGLPETVSSSKLQLAEYLRQNADGEVVDTRKLSTFYITKNGNKSIIATAGQKLVCNITDNLIDDDGWRVKTTDDIVAENTNKLIQRIQNKAGEIIYAQFSQERQNNARTRAIELTLKIARRETLTQDEESELAAIEAGSSWINAVRTKSNELELELELNTREIDDLLDELSQYAQEQLNNLENT